MENKEMLYDVFGSNLSPRAKITACCFYGLDLFGDKSPSYKELAELLNVHKNTAIIAVKELVNKGYLIKKTDHDKRRNVFFETSDEIECERELAAS